MKKLEDYSEEIYKCTKCGLCQSVCPVFEATGRETVISRGKFTLLNGLIKGDVHFSKNLSKYFDLCLDCQACDSFCPSGISAKDIILAVRHECFKLNHVKLIKRLILLAFNNNLNLTLIKAVLTLYKISFVPNILNFIPSKPLNQALYYFNNQITETVHYKKSAPAKEISDLKIAYFPGCINTYINQSVQNAVFIVLEKNGYKIEVPKGLSCCGIPARSPGDSASFKKLAENNVEKISENIDYLITDCASCGTVWDIYAEVLEGKLKDKAKILSEKSVNINKFLAEIEIYIPENVKLNGTVTYHDPCHLGRAQGIKDEPRKLLRLIPGIEFKEMNDSDKCCGAAGSFCLTEQKVSHAITEKKARNILEVNADMVATGCPSCKSGIIQGLISLDKKLPVLEPVEFLALLYLKSNK